MYISIIKPECFLRLMLVLRFNSGMFSPGVCSRRPAGLFKTTVLCLADSWQISSAKLSLSFHERIVFTFLSALPGTYSLRPNELRTKFQGFRRACDQTFAGQCSILTKRSTSRKTRIKWNSHNICYYLFILYYIYYLIKYFRYLRSL